MLDVLLPAFFVLFVTYLARRILYFKKHNLPPGPWGIPFLGYAPFLSKDTFKDYSKLHKKYGPVFGFQNGSHYTVVLGSYSSIKEAYSKDEFSYRPPHIFDISDNYDHIGQMNGLPWKETRRFTIATLRRLGKGENNVEESVKEETAMDLQRLEKLSSDREVNLEDFFHRALTNNVMHMVSGNKYKAEDPELELLARFSKHLNRSVDIATYDFYFSNLGPFTGLRKFFRPVLSGNCLQEAEKLFWKEIESRELFSEQDPQENYLDHYIQEIKKNSGEETSFSSLNLMGNAMLLVFTGNDTVTSKLTWVFLCLAQYQDQQEKVYQQIIEQIGKEKPISWKDRECLPYAIAFIMEVARCKTIAPAIDHHWSATDGEVCGFHVPKNSVLAANLYSVHYDKTLWGDPMVFRPERFLSEDGKSVVQPDYWIPFLTGKRSCPAVKLAMMQLFLIAGSVVQKFQVVAPRSGLSLESEEGSSLHAKKPIVSFRKRN